MNDGYLKTNNKYFYFDYQNSTYGYNTSSSRGADTFVPFKTKHTETYKPTARKSNNDMGATHVYRYVNTTSVPNSNTTTHTVTQSEYDSTSSIDLGSTNTVRYISIPDSLKSSGELISVDIFRYVQIVVNNSSSSLTFLASNTYGNSRPSSTYPAQWYIAGSNDLTTWTEILNQMYTTHNKDYNTQLTVSVSDYKYLRFGAGIQTNNYETVATFKNMVWS